MITVYGHCGTFAQGSGGYGVPLLSIGARSAIHGFHWVVSLGELQEH